MRSFLAALPFAFLTLCCWGVYGPILHAGVDGMGHSRLRPLIGVGLAYFIIAVIIPTIALLTKGEKGEWTMSGTIWSLAAGASGAIGALGIIMALGAGGSPLLVMPLVFGCAPVVNTLVSMSMTRTFKEADIVFYIGIVIVALGAAGVMYFKPSPKAKAAAEAAANVQEEDKKENAEDKAEDKGKDKASGEDEGKDKAENKAENKGEEEEHDHAGETGDHDSEHKSDHAVAAPTERGFNDWLKILGSVALTAICWGSYGSVLHKGTHKLGDSRLRALLCVGLAYLLIAVTIPVILLNTVWHEPGQWTTYGGMWAMLAGSAGAIGALGMILAFNFGGKPIYVMPLVFGGAPVINTFVQMVQHDLFGYMQPMFFASLALVIGGAATVLIFSPKPGKKKAKPNESGDPGDEK